MDREPKNWNYRVIYNPEESSKGFAIHEVYYDESGTPFLWSEGSSSPYGEEYFSELVSDVLYMVSALSQPVLTIKEDSNGDQMLFPYEGELDFLPKKGVE